jgi:cell wall-associated NlpC family hydrolase
VRGRASRHDAEARHSCLEQSLSRDESPERGTFPVGVSGPVGPRVILSRPNPSTNPASVVEERFLRHVLVIGAFALSIAGSGALARADSGNTLPQLDYTGSAQAVSAQTLSPDVAEWTSRLIVHSPSRHHGSMDRFAGGILARASKIAQRLTSSALRFLGVPYVFGGTTASGFDCSGFVQHVFALLGVGLPRTADAQYDFGRPAVGGPRPGDLVFFDTYGGVSHVGIYLGRGEFVHASSSHGVMVSHLSDSYWAARYVGAKRLLATR